MGTANGIETEIDLARISRRQYNKKTYRVPSQQRGPARLANCLELEIRGALMSEFRSAPQWPLHSRALPTAADEGRAPRGEVTRSSVRTLVTQ